jgi:transcription elongation factor GreA
MSEFITSEKRAELETELHHLKNVVRPEVIERVGSARALGDLSENAEYHTAREDQGRMEGRIQYIEHMLKHAKIITRTGGSNAEMGATVTFKKLRTDELKTYILVTERESDLESGKMAITSPIGSAMLGKSVGETFTVSTPRGETVYEIVEIK